MSFTVTTNYGLKKVDVGTELDSWGPIPNENWDVVSTQMKLNADAAAAAAAAAALKAPLASPALTGVPTAPTAAGGTNTTQIATTAFVTAAVTPGGGSGTTIVENPKTASYTLLATDAGKMVTFFSGSTCICTVNTGVFPADSWVQVTRLGDGLVTFAGSATRRTYGGSKDRIDGQYGHATLWFITANEYLLYGDIAAP